MEKAWVRLIADRINDALHSMLEGVVIVTTSTPTVPTKANVLWILTRCEHSVRYYMPYVILKSFNNPKR